MKCPECGCEMEEWVFVSEGLRFGTREFRCPHPDCGVCINEPPPKRGKPETVENPDEGP